MFFFFHSAFSVRVIVSTTEPGIIQTRPITEIKITSLPRHVLQKIMDNQLKDFAGKVVGHMTDESSLLT